MEPTKRELPAEEVDQGRADACAVFARALETLIAAGVPFLVGGGFAVEVYLGAPRKVIKDLDVFLRPRDLGTALAALTDAGFRTVLHEAGWLAKAWAGPHFIDLIFATRNELLEVDDGSFVGAPEHDVLGLPVKVQPVEEVLATKVFVAARDRFDVSDIAHLFLKCGATLDWPRLIDRLAPYVEMLHVHVLLFEFLYPGRRDAVPPAVRAEIESRAAQARAAPAPENAFRGLALDPVAFAVDIERWGFYDAMRVAEPAAPAPPPQAGSGSE